MERRPTQRTTPKEGYDLWSESYDETPNPLVLLDRRHTIRTLNPSKGERILDIGCGTGVHLTAIRTAGAIPVGVDFSEGMLTKAREREPSVELILSDVHAPLPFPDGVFDAVLCALVSEHLKDLRPLCREARRVLKTGGRFVMSAFHPDMAAAGTEANFTLGEVEYRLGAELHSLDDYRNAVQGAGFTLVGFAEFMGDEALAEQIPGARKYVGRNMLLIIEAGHTFEGAF
jgi:ubiquinone/menaquinone biosynthesis C-methylase UbiE